MNRLALLLALVAGCSGGVPGTATDANRPVTRWDACEGCVIGCDVSGVVRCVPYTAEAVGCDRCVAWCGSPLSATTERAFCMPTTPGPHGAFCPNPAEPMAPYASDGIGSCYLDRLAP